jgi:superfamily I DNA/RNA helicase
LKDYKDYPEYIEMAKLTKDAEMNRAIRILEEYSDIENLIGELNYNCAKLPEDAGIVITTCHRAKGLEFDNVIIGEDFTDIPTEIPRDKDGRLLMTVSEFKDMIADELNLMYVAVTRARKTISLTQVFKNVINKGKSLSCC